MDRAAALKAEGMSDAEVEYFTNDGATELAPPAGVDFTESPGGDAVPAATAASTPAPSGTPTADEDGLVPDRDVPYQALLRYKTRAKEVEQRLKEVSDANATEREKFARLDERLRVFREAVEQPTEPQRPAAPPDRETDPFGYMAWQDQQRALQDQRLAEIEGRFNSVQNQTEQERTAQFVVNEYHSDARQFAARQPDFAHAYDYLIKTRDAVLTALGYSDQSQRAQMIHDEERELVGRAIVARRTNPNAAGPAELAYRMAVANGYRQTSPGSQPGNGAAPAVPERGQTVTQQVETIRRGQAASKSLSTAGGTPNAQEISVERLANMSEREYETWKRGLTPVQRNELRAMLGA